MGRSSLNYEEVRNDSTPTNESYGELPRWSQLPDVRQMLRTEWRAARWSQLPDAQDQDSCQMPRTRWRAARMEPAARCPGPDGELPDGAELPG